MISPAHAQVSYTSTTGGSYQQSFDTLLSTGSVPFVQNTATDTTNGLRGWYAYRSGTGLNISGEDGTSSAGNLYSFGSVGSTNRALGSVGSINGDAGDFVWAVRIRNDTDQVITGFTIQYTGEQWRFGVTGTHSLDFSYGIFDSGDASFSNSQISATLRNTSASGFFNVDAMDFFSPRTTGSFGSLVGDSGANRTTLSTTINTPIPVGQDLWVRWNDIDHVGGDHGLATDDFSFTATQFQPVPASPAAVSLGIGGAVMALGGWIRPRFARRKQVLRSKMVKRNGL